MPLDDIYERLFSFNFKLEDSLNPDFAFISPYLRVQATNNVTSMFIAAVSGIILVSNFASSFSKITVTFPEVYF